MEESTYGRKKARVEELTGKPRVSCMQEGQFCCSVVSVLFCEIPWTGEPGKLQSVGSQKSWT